MKTPGFYDPDLTDKLRQPNLQRAFEEGVTVGLSPSSKDKTKTALVLVDPQVDFCIPQPIGNLPVGGAIGDMQRIIETLIFRGASKIHTIITSLDQHIPFQIFFPPWWVDQSGKHPKPYTPITADDVTKGAWRPLYDSAWSVDYVNKLGMIMIWPFHCMVGTPGAALMPSLAEAIMWHSAARRAQPIYVFKGSVPQVEHYGIWEPCVLYSKHPQGGRNTTMLDMVAKFDRILICGEARDFCVKETMKQMLRYFTGRPDVLAKITFVRDCTSLVFPDKVKEEDKFLDEMSGQGVQIVTAEEAIQ